MEEEKKDHGVDQRLDEPTLRPTVQIADDNPLRPSETNVESAPAVPERRGTFPFPVNSAQVAPARHSTQLVRNHETDGFFASGPRSRQQSKANISRRNSRDFDVRRDGPYGRPSITINRRKSTATGLPASPSNERGPTTPGANNDATTDSDDTDQNTRQNTLVTDAPSIETLQSSVPGFQPEPPPLNYTLRTRKLSIFIFWSLILLDSIAMPIGLYFGLHYGTTLSPNAVFSIVTAALGGVSIIEYNLRFWRLWKKGSTCRVIGARRAYLDWFHWNFSLGWVVIIIELIVGTIPTNPPIRLLSMPLASMCLVTGLELLVIDVLRYFHVPAPVRISSIPKGSQLRPGIYSAIEDIVAVDGSGGTEFREALNRRYEASHIFRAMLRRLGAYWTFGFLGAGTLTTILVFTLEHDAAYVVGWSLPFVWAGFWVLGNFWYVDKKLKEEKAAWAEEVATKSHV